MSNNTNSLFWIITGAVIVLAAFLLISATNNNTIDKIFDNFSGYFSKEISTDEEAPPEVNLNQYIPTGWKVLDITMTNGVVYVSGNIKSFSGGGCQFDFRIINTNDYEVHIKNAKLSFINSVTNEVITKVDLPFDRILAKNEAIISFISMGKDLGTINHKTTFIPWS